MKDEQIKTQIEQLAKEVEKETFGLDVDRNCRMLNLLEHLRRAWHEADGSRCEFNDLIKP